MFCKKCGKQIDIDSILCRYCGQNVSGKVTRQETNKNTDSNDKSISKQKLLENNSVNDRYYSPLILGVLFLLVKIILAVVLDLRNNKEDTQLFGVINLIGRIITLIILFEATSKLNRSYIGWAIFGFLFPILALISIGLVKRKKGRYEDIPKVDFEEQLRLLERKDENHPLVIQNKRNKELHDSTVKEWRQFIKA